MLAILKLLHNLFFVTFSQLHYIQMNPYHLLPPCVQEIDVVMLFQTKDDIYKERYVG